MFDLLSKILLVLRHRINAASSSETSSTIMTLCRRACRRLSGTHEAADHWVVGASRSFYLETSVAVKETRALAVMLQLPTMLALLTWLAWATRFMISANGNSTSTDTAQQPQPNYSYSYNDESYYSYGLEQQHVAIPKLCQEGLASVACQAHIWRRMLVQLSISFTWMLALVVWVLPSNLWSEVTELSAVRLNDISMVRQLQLPWLLIPLL
eukprot:scaffold2669_cov41-Prasinocladus_malaysianus.AAC.1